MPCWPSAPWACRFDRWREPGTDVSPGTSTWSLANGPAATDTEPDVPLNAPSATDAVCVAATLNVTWLASVLVPALPGMKV